MTFVDKETFILCKSVNFTSELNHKGYFCLKLISEHLVEIFTDALCFEK